MNNIPAAGPWIPTHCAYPYQVCVPVLCAWADGEVRVARYSETMGAPAWGVGDQVYRTENPKFVATIRRIELGEDEE